MKKFKILFAFFAVVIALGGVFAFTQSKKETVKEAPLVSSWYLFTGNVADINEVKDATKYVYNGSSPICSQTDYICEIYAPGPTGVGSHPTTFNNTQKAELAAAFGGGGPSANVHLKN